MCACRGGVEDCYLIRDPITARMVCWAHPPIPIPREPADQQADAPA